MDIEELSNLDPSDIGSWPWQVKAGVIAAACVVLAFLIWYFDISSQRTELLGVKDEEVQLKKAFEGKQQEAVNLNALKEQLATIQETFGDLLKQLPSEAEMEGLLIDISQTGLAAGLEFELFKPSPEVQKEFYYELPIEIRVVGQYHQFGEFVSGVSALPRIVTTHNINVTSRNKNTGALVMTTIAKTYRASITAEEE